MKLLEMLISTQRGWILRQILKGAAYAGAAATSALVSHGVNISDPQAVTAALSTIAAGAAELALSRLAAPVAAR